MLVLLGLVAAASRAHHTPGGHGAATRRRPRVGDYLFSIVAVLVVGFALVLIYAGCPSATCSWSTTSSQKGTLRAVTFLLALALAGALIARVHGELRGSRAPRTSDKGPARGDRRRSVAGDGERAPEFKWLPGRPRDRAARSSLLGVIGARSMRRERRGLDESFLARAGVRGAARGHARRPVRRERPAARDHRRLRARRAPLREVRAAARSVRGAGRVPRARPAGAARERLGAPPSDPPVRAGEVQHARRRRVHAGRRDRRADPGAGRAARRAGSRTSREAAAPERVDDARGRRDRRARRGVVLRTGPAAHRTRRVRPLPRRARPRRRRSRDAAASPDVHEPSLADELADPLDVLPERPSDLARMERDVYLSCGTAFYLHHRLRPILREIAANRLLTRHGVDLDAQPDAARGDPRRAGVVDAAARPSRRRRTAGRRGRRSPSFARSSTRLRGSERGHDRAVNRRGGRRSRRACSTRSSARSSASATRSS